MTQKNKRYRKKPNFSGQHLLHNPKIIREIITQAKLSPHECAIDIGAGKGALTTLLANKVRKVLAVEYDKRFVHYLKRKTNCSSNVHVIEQDIRNFKWPKYPFVVVSNIPYSITTPIMKQLLDTVSTNFQRGVIVMEKGAAKRFTSNKIKDFYVIAWRMNYDIQYVREINRSNFSPPPRVDSAVIEIRCKTRSIVPPPEIKQFRALAKYALWKPEASLDIALEGIFTKKQIKPLRQTLKVKVDDPISSLSEEQWGQLFNSMKQHVSKNRWPKIK